MGNVIGIPTTRVSDLFVRQRLLSQVQTDQLDIFSLETQLSTGHRFQAPSEDPDAALRVMGLQRLLERKAQVATNLSTNQSYLSATDTALSTISGMIYDIRAEALGVLGTTATDVQRQAAAQQVEQTILQLLDASNQKFNGRHLFAGTETAVRPFVAQENGLIEYVGNEGELMSYGDIDLLFATNLTGDQVFGAISEKVLGSGDLDPMITADTRLDDLRGGEGITQGSILITAGGKSSTIDIAGATTVGDVAQLIYNNPPQGKDIEVEITATGLTITFDGPADEQLSIREVGGGTTARELGIYTQTPVASGVPVVSSDLDPIISKTTPLDNLFGSKSSAVIRSTSADSDVFFEAPEVGVDMDGIEILFVDDGSVVNAGIDEKATYDPDTRQLTVTVKTGYTEARYVVDAVNTAFEAGTVPLSASISRVDDLNGGHGLIDVPPPGDIAGTTSGGSGTPFDKDSGLQITNGYDTYDIDFSTAETVEDMLNILNMSDAALLAEINADGTGINLRSRLSGGDFTIAENGGITATQLGLRSFTEDTRLAELNHGYGVSTHEGTDFSIQLADTTIEPLEIDISGLQTIGEVIDAINAADPAHLQAQLPATGNGIELIDLSSGSGTLQVIRDPMSLAAIDLGLIPEGEDLSGDTVSSGYPTVTVVSAAPKSNLIFTARDEGTLSNDVSIEFVNDGTGLVTYDETTKTLSFGITAGTTTANDVITMLQFSAYGADFEATLDPTDIANDGSGTVDAGDSPLMAGGSPTEVATATVTFAGTDNDLIFSAVNTGAALNDTQILFNAVPGGPVAFTHDVPGQTLTIDYDPGVTTAQDIIDALALDPLAATFSASLDPADGSTNTGNGVVTEQVSAPMVGGQQSLVSEDVNPLETEGMFTALLKLKNALLNNDTVEAERAIALLDEQVLQMNFARAELGARQQGLDILQNRLENETIDLKTALSNDFDADFAQVISDLTGRQIALEAALRSSGAILQMTLLDYL